MGKTGALVLATSILALGLFSVDSAAEEVCEPPLSLCRTGPVPLDANVSSAGPIYLPGECPDGYACVCVSSRPEVDDCAAQVCVPGKPECESACDCEPGVGCYGGRCVPTFAPVYCCDADRCEPGSQCQHADGSLGLCEDPSCRERAEKVGKTIAGWVERTNACTRSDECVSVGTSTQCGGTCGAFVNRRFAKKLAWAIDNLDDRVCSTYQQDGCPFATPACLVMAPACIDGTCTGVEVNHGPPLRKDVSDAPAQELQRAR